MLVSTMMAATQADSFVTRYRPLLELGRGGMARVYLAESLASGLLHKLVVLKVLNQELAVDPEMRSAFIREAEISARLNHPNIVNVFEVFELGNTPVMVMQYLEGMALSEIISRLQGKVPLKLHLHILCQVLSALHYFHELKAPNGDSLECVHRDMTPHNVMVLHEGGVKVVDFGVAKVRAQSENHTRTGIIKGKVAYMAPEQLLACANVDRRADIYSVGVMLWEAVAGRRMWRGLDPSSRMRAIIKGEVPPIREAAPSVSDALVRIIERALAHTPDGRYATAEEMQIELEQIAHTEGGYSLPRELAEFMRLHFGDDRREKQRAIDKAVEDPEFSVADATFSAQLAPAERSSAEATGPAPSVIAMPSRTRKVIVGMAVAACVCLGALTLSEPAHPSARDVDVKASRVVVPASARPADGKVASDHEGFGSAQEVETRAAFAQPAGNEEDAGKEPSAEAHDDEPGPRHVPVRNRRPLARPEPPVRAKPLSKVASPLEESPPPPPVERNVADECDPPYRIDSGGVKVFKPQCF